MSATLPAVLKVGGSLLNLTNLNTQLAALREHLAVPVAHISGGGSLVDVVRDWHVRRELAESVSHELAMQALDIAARLLHEVCPDTELCPSPHEVRSAWSRGHVAVIAPHAWFTPNAGWFSGSPRLPTGLLPESWDVTSDTLAACVAIELDAHLVLLKSTDPPAGLPLVEWAQHGLVDATFSRVAAHLRQLSWINLRGAGTLLPVDLNTLRNCAVTGNPCSRPDGENHLAGWPEK